MQNKNEEITELLKQKYDLYFKTDYKNNPDYWECKEEKQIFLDTFSLLGEYIAVKKGDKV